MKILCMTCRSLSVAKINILKTHLWSKLLLSEATDFGWGGQGSNQALLDTLSFAAATLPVSPIR